MNNRTYTKQDDPMKVVALRLTNWHTRKAKKIGDGNLSEGVRVALESYDSKNGENK